MLAPKSLMSTHLFTVDTKTGHDQHIKLHANPLSSEHFVTRGGGGGWFKFLYFQITKKMPLSLEIRGKGLGAPPGMEKNARRPKK